MDIYVDIVGRDSATILISVSIDDAGHLHASNTK
jgi:hypothetical protein